MIPEIHTTPYMKQYTFQGPQTAFRAELVALKEAILEGTRSENEYTIIYTDCLSAMYGMLKWKRLPNRMKYHNHRDIISEILQLIDEHPEKHFIIHKVKSHVGITGNEIADEGAKNATIKEKEIG